MNTDYQGQDRGSSGDYARYLAGMDASMRQKVALTAAHLLCEGQVADMGTGSGGASYAFAQLYPRLSVIGVDVAETMVELARARHRLPNLRFVVGDAAALVFEPGSLDGILASSMLHHVTSFGGYDHDAARRALAVQVAQLKPHGVLVVRDFVDPGEHEVLLDLPGDDGDDSDQPERCATARLFERFAREFRPLSTTPGFALTRADGVGPALAPGFRRYRTSAKLAAEFILRKDYRADWDSEIKEEYTYFTQARFEAVLRELGLRVLTSTPIYNPWIVKHRYRDKLFLHALDGSALEAPPTNYLIVGERVVPDQGVDFRAGDAQAPLGFLQMEHYRDLRSQTLRDLVRRPNTTLDVVPWFEERGVIYVLVRTSYPRPLLCAEASRARPLDGSRACPFMVEPLTFIQGDRPLGQTIEQALQEYAQLGPERLLSFEAGSDYYPSPGGVAERIESSFVRIAPTFVQHEVGQRSGFRSSGRVQAIEAEQLLRAGQVGGLSDARVELNVYDLLRRQGRGFGPWLGEELEVPESAAPARIDPARALLAVPPRRSFQRVAENPAPYLALRCCEFEELAASGEVLTRRALEYVVPSHHAAVTVSVALVRRHQGTLYLGLDDDDLPAAQCFVGNSNLWVTPAYRLPAHVGDMAGARALLGQRLAAEYGLELEQLVALGGKYHPTPGATPEVVHPFAASVRSERAAPRQLAWTPLDELLAHASALRDGHLRIALWRVAHALGVGETAGT
jgi:SAM-dependent methyltransferase